MSGLLDQLAARKAELVAELVTDIPIPQWDRPTLHLRVQPVDHTMLRSALAPIDKVKGGSRALAQAEKQAHATVIAHATLAVIMDRGQVDEAEVPLSNPELRVTFGLSESSSSADVVRCLMLRDGDLLAVSNAVAQFSGYSAEDLETSFAGE